MAGWISFRIASQRKFLQRNHKKNQDLYIQDWFLASDEHDTRVASCEDKAK